MSNPSAAGPAPDPQERLTRLVADWTHSYPDGPLPHGLALSGVSQAHRVIALLVADLAAVRAQLETADFERQTAKANLAGWYELEAWGLKQKLSEAEADLTALRAERDETRAQLETERIISASRLSTRAIDVGVIEAYQGRLDKAEAELAEARARLAVPPQDQEQVGSKLGRLALPAWQERVDQALEIARHEINGFMQVDRALAMIRKLLLDVPLPPPPAAERETRCDLDPLANVNEMGTGNLK